MADPESTPPADPDANQDAPQAGGRKLTTTLLVVGFVGLVVLIECAIAMWIFPSAEDTQAMAQAMLAAKTDADPLPEIPVEMAEEEEEQVKVEVDLGQYDVSSYLPETGTTLRISAGLWGVVLTEEEPDFQLLLEAKQQRIREQVLVTLRSAKLQDLTEAGLGLIKRRILETTNRTLGKPLLKEIILSDFSLVEQ